MVFEIILYGVFAVGMLAILTLLGRGVVNKIRGRDNGDWRDDLKPGDPPRLVGGDGPNPGAWG